MQNIPENKHQQFNSKESDKQQQVKRESSKVISITTKKMYPLHPPLPCPPPSKDKNIFTSGITFQTPPAEREKQAQSHESPPPPPGYVCCLKAQGTITTHVQHQYQVPINYKAVNVYFFFFKATMLKWITSHEHFTKRKIL